MSNSTHSTEVAGTIMGGAYTGGSYYVTRQVLPIYGQLWRCYSIVVCRRHRWQNEHSPTLPPHVPETLEAEERLDNQPPAWLPISPPMDAVDIFLAAEASIFLWASDSTQLAILCQSRRVRMSENAQQTTFSPGERNTTTNLLIPPSTDGKVN